MLENNITQLLRRQCSGRPLAGQPGIDIAKNPRSAMACATDHYAVSAGVRKNRLRLLR